VGKILRFLRATAEAMIACHRGPGAFSSKLKTAHGILAFLLAGGFASGAMADTFVREDIITDPDPARFNICYNHSCDRLAWAKLDTQQWQRLRALFAPPAGTPSGEREQIRAAIALFESIVGAMTGTAGDKGRNWTGFGLPGQMDCIDESTNTTIYLRMLQKAGVLHWHDVADRSTRWSLFSWPHTTAVIEERASQKRWAVDSWFLDNGEPPYVLPMQIWKDGWQPQQTQAAAAAGR
jgi:hypothetical protein